MGNQWTVETVEADQADERDEREESIQDEPFDGDPMQIGEAFGDDGEDGAEADEGQADQAAESDAGEPQPEQEKQEGEGQERTLPAYWDEETKKQFAELPPELHDKALAWEKGREAFVSRKSQELSRATEKAAGAAQIMQMMETNPSFRAHVVSFGQQQQENNQQGTEQPPEDPLEFIEWKAKQAAMQELTPRLEKMQQQFTASQQQQRRDTAKALIQRDEHYPAVHQAIAQEVKDVAERFGEEEARRLYSRLDSDPDFYMRRYQAIRDGVVKAAQKQDTPGDKTATEVTGTVPKGRTVTERAPVLEGAGSSAQANEVTARRREARKRVKAYKGSLTDIGELFGDPD